MLFFDGEVWYNLKDYRMGGIYRMIHNQKTRLMTRCAIYDKHEGADDLKKSRFFRADYVRLEILKTIVGITVGYLIILINPE